MLITVSVENCGKLKEVSDVQMILVSLFLFFLSNKCFLVANLLEESQPEIFVIETEEDADAKGERVITTYKPQAEDEVSMDLLMLEWNGFIISLMTAGLCQLLFRGF